MNEVYYFSGKERLWIVSQDAFARGRRTETALRRTTAPLLLLSVQPTGEIARSLAASSAISAVR